MKIGDLVVDWLNGTPLFEMAHQRKKAMEIVSNHQHQLATHLVKCLHYDVSNETKHHWMAEINAWLGKINALKLKNGKKLSGDVYYNLLFNEPLGEITDLEGIIETIDTFDGMDNFDKTNSIHTVHECCEKILHSVSHDISNGKAKKIQHYIEMYS